MQNFVYKVIEDKIQINKDELKKLNEASTLLIQVFSGEEEQKTLKILKELHSQLPKAIIITASTDGEIFQDEVCLHSTVISISSFEHTDIRIAYVSQENSYEEGKALAKKLCTPKTKLLLSFTDGLTCNGEEFLNGIYSVAPDVIVAGGLAGDNAKFEKCFIGINEKLYSKGAVGVAFDSDILLVQSLYNFGWQPIGFKHTITKSFKNRVYTIDGISAVDFYKKYLGDVITDKLPLTGIEFPLILKRNDLEIARAVVQKHDDNSLSFVGNIKEGSTVYLGIGERESILANHINKTKVLNVEAFFIYSCMARRRFIPDLVHQELTPFASLAPTSGFFTYGEFFTDSSTQKPELLNQTLTALALSETTKYNSKTTTLQKKSTEKNRAFEALMHIIEVTSKELQERIQLQEKINKELSAKTKTLERIQEMSGLGSWELDLDTMKVQWSEMSYKIYNRDPSEAPPDYLEFLNMVIPKDREKLINAHKTSADGELHSIEIRVRRDDGKIITVLESGKMLYDEDNHPLKIVGTTFDITDLRLKDTMLMQQARSAQMGDMINMIAHQWRQPLNAISSAAIKLNLQSSMGIATTDEIEKTTHFIEDMTQKMSQTINDFMNFTKPTKHKEDIDFNEILEEILKIMGQQLKNNNISITTEIEPDIHLHTFKKELEHILINIISNARDALEALDDIDKNIHIHIYEKHSLCIIKIKDNAGGIDEAIINRIFDPYFTTKEASKGTGLGLYMSKKILHEHLDGEIFVRNFENGAEFTIILDTTKILDTTNE